eukprot:jgi/Picre1/34404/NNA_001873.t1
MEISKRLRTTTNLTESQVTNSASIQQEGGLESADAQEDEREKGRPGSSLVSQLLSQQADTEVKANTPKERAYSVTLSTDQLRDIVESRHRQLMKEVTSLKGSVLVMMQCLVSILSDTGEKHTPTSLHHPLHSAPAAPDMIRASIRGYLPGSPRSTTSPISANHAILDTLSIKAPARRPFNKYCKHLVQINVPKCHKTLLCHKRCSAHKMMVVAGAVLGVGRKNDVRLIVRNESCFSVLLQ